MADYVYSIADDFPNHKVDPTRLAEEVRASNIVTALDVVRVAGDDCTVAFKAVLSAEDETILDGLVAAHSGEPLPQPGFDPDGTPIITLKKNQSDGIPQFALSPREGSELVIASHNYCDPCSWFGDSVRVTDETLVDTGDGLRFGSEHVNWIDSVSGRFHNDDYWAGKVDHHYYVNVTIDGAAATQCPPCTETGGDYWVDWDAGQIVFCSSQSGKTIVASYSYATGNTFVIKPRSAGTTIRVEDAEVDFTIDAVFTTPFFYQVWGYADAFAPELVQPDGPLPPGTQIPLYTQSFKKMSQICAEAKGAYPVVPAVGATAEELLIEDIREFRRKSRGNKHATGGFPFSWRTTRDLVADAGMEMRIYTAGDIPFGGESITFTIYTTESTST